MRTLVVGLPAVLLGCLAFAGQDESWKQPLDVKARLLEQNVQARHNILGLYPSQVEVPLDGRPVDNSTLGIGNIAHAICWTSYYLDGACYRYAALKKMGAPDAEVQAAQKRADEVFEAIYRCQLVTGVRGLQARGYAIGHGESYEERWGDQTSDEWHQGAGEYKDLRWRSDPSHHNYSDGIQGLGHYYDLVAQGKQKERCREAIDALVSYWVDNGLLIHNYGDKTPPVPILGLTDGHTINTRIMMAIGGAKVAHHATGNEKFKKLYDQLCAQYGVRGLKEFGVHKNFDDAEHVFCHLENLFRIETEPELLAGFRVVLDGLWASHHNDAQSPFTYIYLSLTPNAPDRDKALKDALFTLQTFPTDMTLRPRMNSVFKDRKPPYPVYQASWDNEYLWKGSLLQPDGWLARTVTDVVAPAEDPMVLYALDEQGNLYQSRDGGAMAAGWRAIDQGLHAPVRAMAAANKIRVLAVACDDGFYKTTSSGYKWQPLPVPSDGGKPTGIKFDPANANTLYAFTTKGVYRSHDLGEKFLGESWEPLAQGLPAAGEKTFVVALSEGRAGRLYAMLDGSLFTRRVDEPAWQPAGPIGFGSYAKSYPWLVADPSNPDHAFTGVRTEYSGFGASSLLQETRNGGMSWTNGLKSVYERYAKGGVKAVVEAMIPGDIVAPVVNSKNPQVIFTGGMRGVLKSTDGGQTWQEKKSGLDIPVARSVIAPRGTDWIFAGTPAGLFVSKDMGETWQDANLCPQFEKNTRRELGGGEFIDAYWRALYYGLIDDATAKATYTEAKR